MSNQTPDKTARYVLNTYARAPFVLARGEGTCTTRTAKLSRFLVRHQRQRPGYADQSRRR